MQRALASELTAGAQRGAALGMLNGAAGFGALLAGIGGGYLWQAVGPGAAFLAGAAVIVAGLLLFWLSQRPEARR